MAGCSVDCFRWPGSLRSGEGRRKREDLTSATLWVSPLDVCASEQAFQKGFSITINPNRIARADVYKSRRMCRAPDYFQLPGDLQRTPKSKRTSRLLSFLYLFCTLTLYECGRRDGHIPIRHPVFSSKMPCGQWRAVWILATIRGKLKPIYFISFMQQITTWTC